MSMTDHLQEAHCTKCEGKGTRFSKGFTYEGRTYPDRTNPCSYCQGKGTFPAVDVEAILKLITARGGKFRKSWPSKLNPWRSHDATERRAYYVWRLARFHGGADVTMPMTAMTVISGDPHAKFLDALSDAVAKRVFGTDRAAMNRWGTLLGFVKQDIPGLPESAYEGGAVVTSGQKPLFEKLELG